MTNFLRMRIFAALIAALLFFAFALTRSAFAQQSASPRAKSLNDRIMCMCGGCNEAAGKCNHMGGAFAGPCATAQKEMKEVSERLQSGQSDDLILQSFVQEYGPTVLISPPARGFDLWAWLMPVIVTLAGIAFAIVVIKRWHVPVAVAPAGRVSPELLARARHEMDGEFDD